MSEVDPGRERLALAVVGGTGTLGTGLAWRLARAGYRVVIGSRDRAKAGVAAQAVAERIEGECDLRGLPNAEAAAAADIIFVTVPFASQSGILSDIAAAVAGKIVVDATVPLVPPKVATYQAPAEGSAAARAAAILGDGVTVVSALQNVAAHKLNQDTEIDCDVLVCSDDASARQTTVDLLESIGLRALHAGRLANAAAAEALTSILIGINKRYKVDGAGIRITGRLQEVGSDE